MRLTGAADGRARFGEESWLEEEELFLPTEVREALVGGLVDEEVIEGLVDDWASSSGSGGGCGGGEESDVVTRFPSEDPELLDCGAKVTGGEY